MMHSQNAHSAQWRVYPENSLLRRVLQNARDLLRDALAVRHDATTTISSTVHSSYSNSYSFHFGTPAASRPQVSLQPQFIVGMLLANLMYRKALLVATVSVQVPRGVTGVAGTTCGILYINTASN